MNTSCATESGKSRGQFCTPAQDSRVIAQILRIRDATAATTEYDPTCGSDSLLLQIGGEAARGTDLIAEDACVTAAQPRLIIVNKGKKTKARLVFAIGRKKYQAELLPPVLIIARTCATDHAEIDQLESARAALEQQLDEMGEEHAGEGRFLEDAQNDKNKLTKASATARLREIRDDRDATEERAAITAFLALVEQEADAGAALKTAQEALVAKVAANYAKLAGAEIKTLVVDDKWLATFAAAVHGELD